MRESESKSKRGSRAVISDPTNVYGGSSCLLTIHDVRGGRGGKGEEGGDWVEKYRVRARKSGRYMVLKAAEGHTCFATVGTTHHHRYVT